MESPLKKQKALANNPNNVDVDSPKSSRPLPKGWRRNVVKRLSGKTAGKYDVYFYSPENQKFRSRVKLLEYFQEQALDFNIDDFEFCQTGATSTKKLVDTPPVKKKKKKPVISPKKLVISPKKPSPKKIHQSSFPPNCLGKGKKLIVKISSFPVPIKYRPFYPSHANVWRYFEDCVSVEECGQLKNKWELSTEEEVSLKRLLLLKGSTPPPSPPLTERKKNKTSEKPPPKKNPSTKTNLSKLKERNLSNLSTDQNCCGQLLKDSPFDSGLPKLKSGALKENGEPTCNKIPLKKRKLNLSLEPVKNLSLQKVSKFEMLDKQSSVAALSSDKGEQLSVAQ